MKFKEHLIGGIVSGILTSIGMYLYTKDIELSIISILIVIIMALYPDMDIASKSKRYVSILSSIFLIFLIYNNNIYSYAGYATLIFILLPNLFKHRGLTHTIKFGVFISYILYYMINGYYTINVIYVMIPAIIGYITHLILDKHIKL